MQILPSDIDKEDFYQSKFGYYRRFSFWVVVLSVLCMPMYFVSDCQLFGRFANETLPARLLPFAPLAAFLWISFRRRDYKLLTVATYFVLHFILWCTMWAVYYLPDKTHFSEGAIITQLLFFAVGFSAPWTFSTLSHTMLIVAIVVTHPYVHYQNFDILLSLNIPCWIGICVAHFFMERLYVKNYRTAKRLKYLSVYDELTGAYNRNITKTLIRKDGARFSADLAQPICLAMFDIDHFKQVNDEFGHPCGDRVLKDFAGVVLQTIHSRDIFVRWGGEEFILVMPQTDLKSAAALVEQIRRSVEELKTGVCQVTVSAGISQYDGESYKMAIDCADRALYEAKNGGRNRVEIFGTSPKIQIEG